MGIESGRNDVRLLECESCTWRVPYSKYSRSHSLFLVGYSKTPQRMDIVTSGTSTRRVHFMGGDNDI